MRVSIMRLAWIDRDGKIHECRKDETHWGLAERLFPHSNNPVMSCEMAGYVKTGYYWNGSPYMIANMYKDMNTAQKNATDKLWLEHYEEKKKRKECKLL
jgi:hypothetical protein